MNQGASSATNGLVRASVAGTTVVLCVRRTTHILSDADWN